MSAQDLKCPYCEAWNEVCHDDGFGYAEDVAHQMDCRECNKTFIFHTYISFHYEPSKADCLNDAPHDYKETRAYPERARVMRCEICGDEKPLPPERMAEILAKDTP